MALIGYEIDFLAETLEKITSRRSARDLGGIKLAYLLIGGLCCFLLLLLGSGHWVFAASSNPLAVRSVSRRRPLETSVALSSLIC
jgi:hypothetical protein